MACVLEPAHSFAQVHSKVKQRWVEGDPEILEGMKAAAACAEDGRYGV